MSDHAQVRAGSENWAVLLPEILSHIVDQMDPLLPQRLALMAAGPQVILSTTEGRPRVAATETPGVPDDVDRDGLAGVAAAMLDDVQDLVVTHLHTPWPLTDTDRATYAWAELDGTSLRLGFRQRDSTAGLELPPFPVPDDPPRVVVAG